MSPQRTGSAGIFRGSLRATSIVPSCLCGLFAVSASAAVAELGSAAAARTARRPSPARGLLLRALAVAALVTGSLTMWAPAAVAVPPPAATTVSPSGATATTTPTYIWNAAGVGVTLATAYRLHVRNASGAAVDRAYSAAQAGCAGGGRCSITPTNVLVKGDTYSWNVVAYNPSGWGPWGSWLSFKVGGVPPRVILVAPRGTINTPLPTYIWNAAGGATAYDLWVQHDPSKRLIINRRFTATQVGCADGGRCSFLGVTGGPGSHTWYVRASNAAGNGPWSGGMGFFRR